MAKERVRMGVAGLRFGGSMLKRELVPGGRGAEDIELAAVCDLEEGLARSVAQETAVRACFDLEDLLSDPDIEAVGLFTPPHGRAELVRRCIRAGKHVMTTKPFEMDPDAALDVLREAGRLGMVVHANSPSPLPHGVLAKVDEWREKYSLGAPVSARMWTGKSRHREEADGRWLDDPDLCPVAPVLRVGIYLLNDLAHLFGDADSVNAMETRLFTGRPTADTAQVGVLFKNKALANVQVSFCLSDGHVAPGWILVFENGSVFCNVQPSERPHDWGWRSFPLALARHLPSGEVVVERAEAEGARYQWGNFRRAVRGEELPGSITPEEFVRGVRILAAAARAAKSGRTEQV